MRRRWWISIAALPACFAEPSSSSTSDGDDETTTAASTDATTTTTSQTTVADTSSSDVTASGEATSSPSTTTGTTGPDELCEWSLGWAASARKDILVIVWTEPMNLGALLMAAQAAASAEGTHIAVASACEGDVCGMASEAYQHYTIPIGVGDPLDAVPGIVIANGFFRPRTPRHLVVISHVDTNWTVAEFETELGAPQLDVRLHDADACGNTEKLELIAQATHGSFRCENNVGGTLLEEVVAHEQPECELHGETPGPGPVEQTMTLEGFEMGMSATLVPGGPSSCANEPADWSIFDGPNGHLELCPFACRDVGRWMPGELEARIEYPCP